MKIENLKPAMAYCNLTVRQLAIILTMYKCSNQLLRDVAMELQISRPVVSRAWSSLIILGLIKRVRNEDNRRNVSASLTEKGRKLVKDMI